MYTAAIGPLVLKPYSDERGAFEAYVTKELTGRKGSVFNLSQDEITDLENSSKKDHWLGLARQSTYKDYEYLLRSTGAADLLIEILAELPANTDENRNLSLHLDLDKDLVDFNGSSDFTERIEQLRKGLKTKGIELTFELMLKEASNFKEIKILLTSAMRAAFEVKLPVSYSYGADVDPSPSAQTRIYHYAAKPDNMIYISPLGGLRQDLYRTPYPILRDDFEISLQRQIA